MPCLSIYIITHVDNIVIELEGARASTDLSLLCVDVGLVGYKQWSNARPLCD